MSVVRGLSDKDFLIAMILNRDFFKAFILFKQMVRIRIDLWTILLLSESNSCLAYAELRNVFLNRIP